MTEPIRIELPTIYGMKSVNAYLFLDPEPTLIDCGEKTDASWKALQSALAVYNLAVKDIKKVIITHAHVDHIGEAQNEHDGKTCARRYAARRRWRKF